MIRTEPTYTTDEACRLAGVSYRQADYWCRRRLVAPSASEARGSGSRRRWTSGDILALRVIHLLMRLRVRHEVVRESLELLDSWPPFLWIRPGEVSAGDAFDLLAAVEDIGWDEVFVVISPAKMGEDLIANPR